MPTAPLAFSYKRWSTPEQSSGDSHRRQTAKERAWLAAHPDVMPDNSLRMTDAGVSAFRGKNWENPDVHALAGFREAVKTGRIPRGSYLLVESFDRLTRDHWRKALPPVIELIDAGIRIVELDTATTLDENSDEFAVIAFIITLARGRNESATKSKRSPWPEKKKQASEKAVTRKVPGWIRVVGGEGKEMKKTLPGEVQFELIPDRAKVVQRIFKLARSGQGVHLIAKTLNDEGVPVMGRTEIKERGWQAKADRDQPYRTHRVKWSEAIVYHILTSRTVIGEYQRNKGRGGDRIPDGDPIPDYYPAAVDVATFHAVEKLMRARATHRHSNRTAHLNLFAGLLKDARDGGTFTYKHLKTRGSALIPVGAKQGKGSVWSSFPVVPFEWGVIEALAEVKPSELEDAPVGRGEELDGEIAEIDAAIKVWTAKMNNLAIADLVATKLEELSTTRRALVTERDRHAQKKADPLPNAWSDVRTLADVLRKKNDTETRAKLRTALLRSIESVHCLFTGRGRLRVAAVRVQFTDGNHRNYLISYDPARAGGRGKRTGGRKVGVCRVASMAELDAPGQIDLRDPTDAAAFEMWLNTGDKDKKLQRKGQTPTAVFAKLEQVPPVPLPKK